jgi:death on curing protein
MTEPVWLSRSDVETLHAKVIESSGGSHGLRDANLLESALARPQNLHAYGEGDTFQLAAAYAEGIARNHAFVDGNKRTAFLSAAFFLRENGQELMHREDDGYVELMVSLAQGRTSREQMADYLRINAQQRQTTPDRVDWSARAQQLREQHGAAESDTPKQDDPDQNSPRMKQ